MSRGSPHQGGASDGDGGESALEGTLYMQALLGRRLVFLMK